jgi:hypothetical protein
MRGHRRDFSETTDDRDPPIMPAQERQRISKMFSRNFRSVVW